MQRRLSAREGAKPLPWSPEWLWGNWGSWGEEPGLHWAMGAAWCKAAKQGAQAAGEEVRQTMALPAALPCRLLELKLARLHAGWKPGGGIVVSTPWHPAGSRLPSHPTAQPWTGLIRDGYEADTVCAPACAPDSGLALRHRPSERAAEVRSCKM